MLRGDSVGSGSTGTLGAELGLSPRFVTPVSPPFPTRPACGGVELSRIPPLSDAQTMAGIFLAALRPSYAGSHTAHCQHSAGSQRGPRYMDRTLAAMHRALHWREPLTLLIERFAGHVGLAFECSTRLRQMVQQQLASQYPECEMAVAPARAQITGRSLNGTTVNYPDRRRAGPGSDVDLSHETGSGRFSLKKYRRFEDLLTRTTADPLATLLAAVGDAHHDLSKLDFRFVAIHDVAKHRLGGAISRQAVVVRPTDGRVILMVLDCRRPRVGGRDATSTKAAIPGTLISCARPRLGCRARTAGGRCGE